MDQKRVQKNGPNHRSKAVIKPSFLQRHIEAEKV
jgi:hypothetical protein